ncbi:hypothetical protein ACFE04_019840 [Oxalis oulophora]
MKKTQQRGSLMQPQLGLPTAIFTQMHMKTRQERLARFSPQPPILPVTDIIEFSRMRSSDEDEDNEKYVSTSISESCQSSSSHLTLCIRHFQEVALWLHAKGTEQPSNPSMLRIRIEGVYH